MLTQAHMAEARPRSGLPAGYRAALVERQFDNLPVVSVRRIVICDRLQPRHDGFNEFADGPEVMRLTHG